MCCPALRASSFIFFKVQRVFNMKSIFKTICAISVFVATYLIMYVLFHDTFVGESIAKSDKDLAIFLATINYIVAFFAFKSARTSEKKFT